MLALLRVLSLSVLNDIQDVQLFPQFLQPRVPQGWVEQASEGVDGRGARCGAHCGQSHCGQS